MKESFLKALGYGFRYPVRKLLFTKNGASYVANDHEHSHYRIQVVQDEEKVVYSVCRKTETVVCKTYVDLEKLIHHYCALKDK